MIEFLTPQKELQLTGRARDLFDQQVVNLCSKTSRILNLVLLAQWIFCIGIALYLSPTTWNGDVSSVHPHVLLAIFLGGALSLFPTVFIHAMPEQWVAHRYAIAFSQMMTSVLIIHLTGGRIESHFHIFGSLAFLAAYRNWKVLVFATVITTLDHFVRGAFAPESIYGVLQSSPLRALEHAGWVLFEDTVLFSSIVVARGEMAKIADSQAQLEVAIQIVQEKMAEEAAKSYELLQLTINSIPSLIGYLDKDFTYKFRNETYRTWFGLANLSSDTTDLQSLVGDSASVTIIEKRQLALAGSAVRFDFPLRLVSGEEKLIDMLYRPDFDHEGNVRGLVVLGHDVTERARADETIAQQRAELTAASKFSALGEMAGGVAHEINTPLANILLLTDQIKDGLNSDIPDLEELTVSVDNIAMTVRRIGKIISGLKRISRNTDGDQLSSENIASVIDETLTFCRERFKSRAVELSLECPADLKVECRGVQLSQVILNLLNNAVDAIDGLPEKWIRITVSESQDHAEIIIEDSGSGIPSEIAARVFQPFYTTKEIGKGTGIGLSISKGIIESHNGSLQLDQSSIHTKFVISLPKSQAKQSPSKIAI